MDSKQNDMKKYAWAREPVLAKIDEFLASSKGEEKSVESLMGKHGVEGKIDRQTFISTIKGLNAGILPQMIENFADQLLIPWTQSIDLANFYHVYHHFVPKPQQSLQVSQSFQGPLTASVSLDGKTKILDLLAKYMKSQKFTSLSDFLMIKFERGLRVVPKVELDNFLTKNYPALSQSDKETFFNAYKTSDNSGLLDLEPIQAAVLQIMTPKTLDDFLEETRVAATASGIDLKEVLTAEDLSGDKKLSFKEFEAGLKKTGVNLPTSRVERFFELLDKDKKGKVSPSEVVKELQEYSVRHSELTPNHPLFGILQKIREEIKKLSKPFHCYFKDVKVENTVEVKDFKAIMKKQEVGLTDPEYVKLLDFLDPVETSKIDYDRFFELLGYIQPDKKKSKDKSEEKDKKKSKDKSEKKDKKKDKKKEDEKKPEREIPVAIIPLLKALKKYCKQQDKPLKKILKEHSMKGKTVNRYDLHKIMQELCRGKISDGDIFEGLQQVKVENGEISLKDLSKLYKQFAAKPSKLLPKDKVLKKIARKAEESGVDIKELLLKNDTSTDRTIKRDIFVQVLGDALFLGSDLISALEGILTDYDQHNTRRVYYNVFLDDLKPHLSKGKSKSQAENYAKLISEIAKASEGLRIGLSEKFAAKDYTRKGTVPIEVFVEVLKSVNVKDCNETNFMELAKKYTSPMSSEVQYKLFLSELRQASLKNSSPIKTNLQWANRILDEVAVALYAKHETALTYYKNYGLNSATNTVTLLNFAQGLKLLNVRISERDIEQLGKDLDVFYDGSVSIQELQFNIEERTKPALEKYERIINKQLYDCFKAKGVDLMKTLKKYDAYNIKEVSAYDFERELRLIMGANLDENQYRYLLAKYEKRPGKIAYEQLVQTLESEKGLESVTNFYAANPERVQLVDRLREAIRKDNLKIASKLLELDRAKTRVFQCETLREVFPKKVLPKKDYKQLAAVLDEKYSGSFHFDSVCALLWTNEEEEAFRENAATNVEGLNRKIAGFCRNKKVDIERELVKMDRDNSGYLSSDDIKIALTNLGMPLSYRQLAALLYYQNLPTDSKYRKNYIALVTKIMGNSTIHARFPHIRTEAQSEHAGRKVTFAENVVEEGQKQFPQTPQFKEKTEQVQSQILDAIGRKVAQENIRVLEYFKKADPSDSHHLSHLMFFDVLSKAGISLVPSEEKAVLALPGVSDNDGLVYYERFVQLLPSVKPGLEETKERRTKLVDTRVPNEMTLDEDMITYIMDQFNVLKAFLEQGNVNIETEFSNYSSNGYIDFATFCEVLANKNVEKLAPDVADAFYSYLKEEPEGKISLRRLITTLVKGQRIPQYKSKAAQKQELEVKRQIVTAGLHMRRLSDFMKYNETDPKVFTKYATGKTISKDNFRLCLEDIGFDCPETELEILYKNIDIKGNGEGSLSHLLTLLTEELNRKTGKKVQLPQKVLDTIEAINKELAAKKLSYNQFYKALDINGDGYIDLSEFMAGVTSKLALSIPPDELLEVFNALDVNG